MAHLYYVDLDFGCTLRAAHSEKGALSQAQYAHGHHHVRFARLATAEDVAHIRAMGGFVPAGTIVPEKKEKR